MSTQTKVETKSVINGAALPDDLKTLAAKTATAAWKSHTGILALQGEIAGKRGKMSQDILELARAAADSTADLVGKLAPEKIMQVAISRFQSAMAHAFALVMEKHADAEALSMKAFKATWGQLQSNIKRGMERGLDPRDYPSETAFRKAKQATDTPRAVSTLSEAAKEARTAIQKVDKKSDSLSVAVGVLLAEVQAAEQRHEQAICAILDAAAIKVRALNDIKGAHAHDKAEQGRRMDA